MKAEGEPKTQTIDEAAHELGIGRNQAYAAGKAGRDPHHQNRQTHSGAARAVQKDARWRVSVMPKTAEWPTIAERQKLTSQHVENTRVLEAQKRPPNPSRFKFEQVNEVTWKLTNGEITDTPGSHGQWRGYKTTKAVAWVICVLPGKWLARCRDMVSGPLSLSKAKAAAVAMAKGVAGDLLHC